MSSLVAPNVVITTESGASQILMDDPNHYNMYGN